MEDVKRLAARAQRMPALENSFRNMILNMRVAAHTPLINPQAWKACGGEATIQDGANVYGALDLGSTRDMSALVLIAQDLNGVFHVEPHFWLPGDIDEREKEDHAPYREWAHEGYLTPIGEVTDPKVIALKIPELAGRYRVQTLAFDRWRIGDLKRELDEIGCAIKLTPHGQGYRDMSGAHGNHPVLAMNAASAIVSRDAAGGRKLDKSKSKGKIDGLVSLAMAFNIALVRPEPVIDVNSLIG